MLLGVGGACCIIAGGIYSYLHFRMENAYTHQDYEEVERQANRTKIVSYQARDMLIKSSLERAIAFSYIKNQNSHINPVSEKWQFEVERVLSSQELTYKSQWSDFYTVYIQKVAQHYISSTPITKAPLIYKELQKCADKVSFRGKDIYKASCYLYPVLNNIKFLNENMTFYRRSNKKTKILFQKENKKHVDTMKTSIKVLLQEKDISLNEVFYKEYERMLCDSIEKILNFRKYSKDKEKKQYMTELSLKIYECLQLTEREKTEYISSPEEKKRVIKIYNNIIMQNTE